MEDLLKVGVITTTHGVRGEVKVFPTTDEAERFLELDYVLLDTGRELRKLEIQNVKFFQKYLAILKFKGIDNINDIEMYKGRDLWIPREEGQELEEGEYYVADLIGMNVLLEDGTVFGTLKDVMETGANDVYVIDTKDRGEVLLPATGVYSGCKCGGEHHDCTFDEGTFINEFSCIDFVSGNDCKRNEYKYYRKSYSKWVFKPGSCKY